MTDLELESQLKGIPLPSRTEDYWEQFPSSIRRQLPPALVMQPRTTLAHRLTWSSAVAVAGLVFALGLWPTLDGMVNDARVVRRQLAELPGHLRVLMADEHGMHYLITDKP